MLSPHPKSNLRNASEIMRGIKDWKKDLPSEEELQKMDLLAEEFRTQKWRISNEGKSIKILNPANDNKNSVNDVFSYVIAEYVRYRKLVLDLIEQHGNSDDWNDSLGLQRAAYELRDRVDHVNQVYFDALGKNLVDRGLGA